MKSPNFCSRHGYLENQFHLLSKVKLRKIMTLQNFSKGEKIDYEGLMLVHEGKVELSSQQDEKSGRKHVVGKGDFWGGEKMISNTSRKSLAKATTRVKVYNITDIEILKQIPIIRWKLLEQTQKRD